MKTVGLLLIVAGCLWGGYDWLSADTIETSSIAAQVVVDQPTVDQPVVTQPSAQMTLPPEVAHAGIIDYKEIEGAKWVGFREDKAGAEDTWISCEMVLAGAVALPEPSIWYVETYCNE